MIQFLVNPGLFWPGSLRPSFQRESVLSGPQGTVPQLPARTRDRYELLCRRHRAQSGVGGPLVADSVWPRDGAWGKEDHRDFDRQLSRVHKVFLRQCL